DPWALRALAVLAVAVALPGLWGDGASRLYRAVIPDFAGGPAAEVSVDVWLQPPEYTGLSPIYLQPRGGQTVVRIPAGSTLLARVHGGRGTPRLDLSGTATPFTKIESGEYEARMTVTEGERLAIRQGPREIAVWPIAVVPDTAPEIAFLGTPTGTAQSTLRVDFEARDDYGVVKGELVLRRAGAEDGEAIAVPLPIHGGANSRDSAYLDLTSHVWAGLAVVGQMTATDALGQTGASARLNFVLPERRFTNPIARAIIEQRKRLILNPNEREPVALSLDAIAQRVIERVKDGVLVMGLASARGRLLHDRTPGGVKETIPLLWDLALRAEDGDLSLAARDLRAIEDRLAEALERGAGEEELEKLFAELRQALDRYMQALMEQLEQRMKAGENVERINRDDLTVGAQDLQKLIDEARQLMRAGARDLARQLLSQLRNTLENMRAGVAEQGRPQNNVGAQMMNELRALTERQQGLMEQMFRQFQEGRRPGQTRSPAPQAGLPTTPENLSAAEQQAQIRQALDAFSKKLQGLLGQAPGQMGEAGRTMERAIDSFTGNHTARGVEQQGEALEALRQAGRAMAQQLMERFAGSGNEGSLDGRSRGQGRDGLGRPAGGNFGASTEDVGIPDENEIRKAREILDELRKRAGDRNRPPIERQYLERLLPRF
ncbi:MAG: DUF4175 domain-containing protein, partial [Alphaproteobacteria bacterium]|nr:DUF4175 domain-containing protein [Alphaproteobacteria bacterium]